MFGGSFISANVFQLRDFVQIQEYLIQKKNDFDKKQLKQKFFRFSWKASSGPVDVHAIKSNLLWLTHNICK